MRRLPDGGMVTVELAACLPVLVVVIAVAVSAVGVAGTQVRAQDAAREAARAAARGDVTAAGRLARSVAPGARLSIATLGPDVVATVEVPARPLLGWLPVVEVSAGAVAAREP